MLELLGISLIGVGLVTYVTSAYKLKKEKDILAKSDDVSVDEPKLNTVPMRKCTLSREEREFIRDVLKDEYYSIRFDEFGGVSGYKVAGDPDKIKLYPHYLGDWNTVSLYASDLNYIINVRM